MSMAQKRFRQACGIVAALGFLLILGTAGASDYDLTASMERKRNSAARTDGIAVSETG